jgi:molecular chaperone GrpE (heat shock protein)
MSDPEISPDSFVDFAEQMESLTSEAQRKLNEQKARSADPVGPNLSQTLRPMLLAIQALGRATEENTQKLAQVAQAVCVQRELPSLLSDVRETLQQKQAINQKLFDALHSELKDYKDGFLLDVMQKPIILDLIALFDDLEKVSHQLADFAHVDDDETPDNTPAATLSTNLDHTLGTLLEVLERMEVVKLEPSTGQRLDKVAHRAVKVELADSAQEDGEITESLKSGFMWKDRLLRPEEVTVRKYKEGYITMLPTQPSVSQR